MQQWEAKVQNRYIERHYLHVITVAARSFFPNIRSYANPDAANRMIIKLPAGHSRALAKFLDLYLSFQNSNILLICSGIPATMIPFLKHEHLPNTVIINKFHLN